MSVVGLPIVMVLVVVFLAVGVVGRHGWKPDMRVMAPLLVLAAVPCGYLFLARSSHVPVHQAAVPTRNAFVMDTPQVGSVTVDRQGGVHFLEPLAQARPPIVRGRWSVLFLLVVVGGVVFGVVYQLRRGAWSMPAVAKAVAFGLIVAVSLVAIASWRDRARARLEREKAVDQVVRVAVEERLRASPGLPVVARDVAAATASRDVENWRRESVLGFAPSSHPEVPDWCREDLETKPQAARFGDTTIVSPLPEGREWVVGYSSLNPQMAVAQSEAITAARRKLGLAALARVKQAVPELDVRPLEELAPSLARQEGLDRVQSQYVEKAALERDQRTYGTVYRVAVRMAADPATVDRLARRICHHVDRYGTGQPDLRVAFLSGLILVVLAFSAFLVYVFIRAGAAGRWAYPLRLVAGGMLAALVAAAIYVSVHLQVS